MTRIGSALLALLAAAFLVAALLGPGRTARPFPLALLAIAGLAWFLREHHLIWLAVIVPLGPILDFPFLTPDRAIYATEVVLLTAVIWWATRQARHPHEAEPGSTRFRQPVGFFSAFALVGAIGLGLGHPDLVFRTTGARALRVLTLALATSVLFLQLGRSSAQGRSVVRLWTFASLVSLVAIGAVGIGEFVLARGGEADSEPGSFYRGSVALAVHIAFLAPLALSLWLAPLGRRWRWLSGIGWVVAMVCLPLTASRGAMASVLLTTVLLLLVAARRWRRGGGWSVLVVLCITALGLTALALRPEIAGESFAAKIQATVAGDYFSTRTESWREATEAIAAQPLAGEDPASWAPSIPLELARRHGIPAALLALAAIVAAAAQAARAGRRRAARNENAGSRDDIFTSAVGRGLAAGLAGLLLVGLAETALGARVTPLLAAALGIAGGLERASRPSGQHRLP